MVYEFGAFNYGYKNKISAQTVGEEFERIESECGSVTPENVLEEARADTSVLHKLFEWNDTIAAEKYRLVQSGRLIRSIVTVVKKDDGEPIQTRAYVNVSTKHEGSFVSVVKAFKQVESREVVLTKAKKELEAFKEKYKTLIELSEVFDAIDDLLGTERV